MAKIPHRLYLTEDQMPKQWYNLRADMKEKPDPLIHPGTHQPLPEEALYPIFCQKLAHQELDNDTRYIDIPEPVLDMYKLYRPSPLCRAYNLEKALDTPAKIYYKFEGNNTSGSHKLNSAIAQAYYAKEQGLKGLTTETGAGQWGTALSEACAYFGLDLKVFMVKVSYEQKPFRKAIMQTFDANVTPSPSNTTEAGRAILAHDPTTGGSLGCAISEAVEVATSRGLPLCTRLRAQSGAAAPVHHRSGEQAGYGDARRVSGYRNRLCRRRLQPRRPDLPVHAG